MTVRDIVSIATAIGRDRTLRRQTMFFGVLFALAQVFLGATWLEATLGANRLLFVLYWFGCLWVTLTVALIAIFDLLIGFRESRRGRRK